MLAALAVAEGTVLCRQHEQAAELGREIARRQAEARREQARLQEENRRLTAAQPTERQLEDMAAKLVLADQLRSQLATMHRRVETAAAIRPAADKPAIPSLVGNSVAAGLWQDAGRATPAAAFETTLWAAAHGDLDALAGILAFDPETARQAAATFDRLPVALQNELGTPERMIALLTAADVPLGRASILGQYPGPAGTNLTVQLVDAGGSARTAVFALQPQDDQWRLTVPPAVMQKYSDWLKAFQAGENTGRK